MNVRWVSVARSGECEPTSMATQRELCWRKSTACVTGECVEVAHLGGLVLVRSSCRPEVTVPVSGSQWRAFIATVNTPPATGTLDSIAMSEWSSVVLTVTSVARGR